MFILLVVTSGRHYFVNLWHNTAVMRNSDNGYVQDFNFYHPDPLLLFAPGEKFRVRIAAPASLCVHAE